MTIFKNKKVEAHGNDAEAIAVGTTQAQLVWRQFKKNRGAMVGLAILIFLILTMIFSSIVFDYKTDIIGKNSSQRFITPCLEHPFGTDQMGRSVLARVAYGTRYSFLIGFGAVAFSLLVGSSLGCIAGYYGGWVESVIMRTVEIFLMFPNMLLTIVIVAFTGVSLQNLVICFGIAGTANFARTARAAVLSVGNNEYVEAARACGVKDFHIILTHILPNALSPILVQATLRLGACITTAAGFSFLGLGVPVPTPEWGAMLSDGKEYIRMYPHLVLFPGLAIFLTVLSINLIGDGLRDALDPKLKR